MYDIKILNNIAEAGIAKFPSDLYRVSEECEHPDAILVRSYKMHDMPIPPSLKAVGRAGAGVNNIPLECMSAAGIPVFNAPGANANAVKELVIASLFLTARHLHDAIGYTESLQGDDAELSKMVEAGKKKYAGVELPGKAIGVIGLGAIGRMVANSCVDLGMQVIGFDPGLTVDGAWQLSSQIQRAQSVEEMLPQVDFLTLHVPLISATRDLINAQNISLMKSSAVVLNLARGGIVNDQAVCAALSNNGLSAYVTDFPSNLTKSTKNVINFPHLGASTSEAEENCAMMVVMQVREFLESGNIRNSVNFPAVSMPRGTAHRLLVANANVPNMVGQISTLLAEFGLNINDMINQSQGELAYTIADVDSHIDGAVMRKISCLDGIMSVRAIQ